MISVNATIIVQVCLFLILMVILNKKMFKPLHQLMMERAECIKQKEADLERLEEELKDLEKQYERRLQQASREAAMIREKYNKEGREVLKNTMVSVQEQVSELRRRVHQEVQEELSRARENLTALAEALSYDLTEKFLRRRM